MDRPFAYGSNGADGRITLVRGENSISAYENSRFQVKAQRSGSILTRVLQDAGQLLFQVERRAGRHSEVETPYLVAGVKGTTFGVDVSDIAASVSVVEGLVGVADPETGQEVDVAGGQTAQAGRQTDVATVGRTVTSVSTKWNERVQRISKDAKAENRGLKAGVGPGKSGAKGSGKSGGNDNGNSGGNSNSKK